MQGRCLDARRYFPRPRGPHRRPFLAPAAPARAGCADPPPTPAGRRDDERPHHAGDVQKLRSEEHTSELQSLMRISYAVFCLKKKKHKKHKKKYTQYYKM